MDLLFEYFSQLDSSTVDDTAARKLGLVINLEQLSENDGIAC